MLSKNTVLWSVHVASVVLDPSLRHFDDSASFRAFGMLTHFCLNLQYSKFKKQFSS